MSIRGLTPGYMIGERGPRKRWASEFTECPACGGRMHRTAELCQDCHEEHANTFGPIDLESKKERDERFRLAEQAGWTVQELLELARQDKLPTREQIVKRMINNWFKEGDK